MGVDQTMNKTRGTTVGTAVAGAILCLLALAGCHGKGHAANGAGPAVAATSPAAGANPGDGVPEATPTGAAAVDSELDTVDQQLGAAGTDLAQATQSPSDGG